MVAHHARNGVELVSQVALTECWDSDIVEALARECPMKGGAFCRL